MNTVFKIFFYIIYVFYLIADQKSPCIHPWNHTQNQQYKPPPELSATVPTMFVVGASTSRKFIKGHSLKSKDALKLIVAVSFTHSATWWQSTPAFFGSQRQLQTLNNLIKGMWDYILLLHILKRYRIFYS